MATLALLVCAHVPSAGIATISVLQLLFEYQFNFGLSHLPWNVQAEPQPLHATWATAPTRCLLENGELAGHATSPSLTMHDVNPGGA